MSQNTVSPATEFANFLMASLGREAHLPPLGLIQQLRRLVASLPRASLAEQLLARSFVAHHLARISLAFVTHPDVVTDLVSMTASPWVGDQWLGEFCRLTDRIELTLQQQNHLGPGHRPLEVRISNALVFVKTHYADPGLTLQRVADEVGLSPSYLGHTLKQQTGEGFVAHLRRVRVQAARRLLEESVCSIKQVAAATGYKTPRQLERDFKRLNGVPPTAIWKAAPQVAVPSVL